MADRTDIDALLIGALYGELTPADEARLTAHLESHPADRTALSDLTRTRAAIRDSRLLAIQLEPSHSISALLVQEAARWSRPSEPSRSEERGRAGWFFRFTQLFMAHPAMAAAAMLVLVVGVAGTLYVRRGDQLAEMAVDQRVAMSESQVAAPAAASAQVAAGASSDGEGTAAGSSGPGTQFDQISQRRTKTATPGASDDATTVTGRRDEESSARPEQSPGNVASAPQPPPPPPPRAPAAKKSAAPSGIELRRPALTPKDLDEREIDQGAKRKQEKADVEKADAGKRDLGRATFDNAPAIAAAPSSKGRGDADAMTDKRSEAASEDPSGATGGPPKKAAIASREIDDDAAVNRAKRAPAKTLARPEPTGSTVADAPAPREVERDRRAVGGAASDTAPTAEDKALLAWAQKQHDQVVSLVRSNNCRAAASAAVEIYNRAPGYYAANVTSDRQVRPCLAYLESERNREERKFAAKRSTSPEPPAAAKPPAAATESPAATPPARAAPIRK
jgi:hypothetical protein